MAPEKAKRFATVKEAAEACNLLLLELFEMKHGELKRERDACFETAKRELTAEYKDKLEKAIALAAAQIQEKFKEREELLEKEYALYDEEAEENASCSASEEGAQQAEARSLEKEQRRSEMRRRDADEAKSGIVLSGKSLRLFENPAITDNFRLDMRSVNAISNIVRSICNKNGWRIQEGKGSGHRRIPSSYPAEAYDQFFVMLENGTMNRETACSLVHYAKTQEIKNKLMAYA